MITFSDLGLNSKIIKSLTELGYENPTPIQEKSIPFLLEYANDLKAFAQTGTGKTAAFSLPILEQIDPLNNSVQAMIISPTRELAIQIAKNIEEYAKYLDGVEVLAIYGGANINQQIKTLRKGVQIVVGTPGRMVDVMNRKALDLSNIQWLVLDEADEMLNMGFKDELDKLLKDTPKEKQTLLFSATFPKEVERIAKNYLVEPHEMSAGKKNIGSENVTHKYFEVTPRNRYYALKRIVDVNPGIYGIVFCRTKRETQEVADKLINDNYNADSLHGDLSQVQRDIVMKKFRQKNLQILVATDVAARGLDVNDLTHVINYNLPDQAAAYTHRSGRTGRAGKKGDSMVLVSGREKGRLAEIERKIGKKFEKTPIPNGKEVCRNQVYHLIDRVKETEVNETEIKEFLPKIYEKLADFDREELIKRFVSLEFNIFLSYYENTSDLNVEHASNDSENMTRYFINIGKKDHLSPSKLIGLINEQEITKNIEIGKIEVLQSFSFFELDKNFEKETLQSFKKNPVFFNGRQVNVELTQKPKRGRGRKKGGKKDGKKGGYNTNNSRRNSRGKGKGRKRR